MKNRNTNENTESVVRPTWVTESNASEANQVMESNTIEGADEVIGVRREDHRTTELSTQKTS